MYEFLFRLFRTLSPKVDCQKALVSRYQKIQSKIYDLKEKIKSKSNQRRVLLYIFVVALISYSIFDETMNFYQLRIENRSKSFQEPLLQKPHPILKKKLPSFIIFGVKKCGTGALKTFLSQDTILVSVILRDHPNHAY